MNEHNNVAMLLKNACEHICVHHGPLLKYLHQKDNWPNITYSRNTTSIKDDYNQPTIELIMQTYFMFFPLL